MFPPLSMGQGPALTDDQQKPAVVPHYRYTAERDSGPGHLSSLLATRWSSVGMPPLGYLGLVYHPVESCSLLNDFLTKF